MGLLIAFRIAGARHLYHHPLVNRWLSSHAWGLRLKQLIGSFNALRERPRYLFVTLGLSMLNHVFWCASLLLVAIALGNAVSPMKGFVVFPLAIFETSLVWRAVSVLEPPLLICCCRICCRFKTALWSVSCSKF